MTTIATKSQFAFDPVPTAFLTTSIAADLYTTPSNQAETLGDMARLSYLKASLKGMILLDASDTVVFDIHLKAGTTTLETVEVTITAGTRGEFEMADIDFSGVLGQQALTIVADVTTNGASANAQVYAKLNVEMPFFISGCD